MADIHDLSGTRTYAGWALSHFFLGPVGFLLYGVVLVTFGIVWEQTGNVLPLTVSALLLAFALLVLHLFLQQKLFNERTPLRAGGLLTEALAPGLVKSLSRRVVMESRDLVQAALESDRGKYVLLEMGATPQAVMNAYLKSPLATATLESLLLQCEESRKVLKENRIDAPCVLHVLFLSAGPFTDVLNACDLSTEDVVYILHWEQFHDSYIHVQPWWSAEGFVEIVGPMGRTWASGYTNELDRLTTDIFAHEKRRGSPVVIHHDRIEQILHVLSRANEHNVLIVGRKGVGKSMLIENVARILREEQISKGKAITRVLQLNTAEFLSGGGKPDELLLQAIRESERCGHLFLVIENIHLVLQASSANLKAMLMKLLQAANISVIAVATPEEYHRVIRGESGVDALFDKILLDDAKDQETMTVLMEKYFNLEQHDHVHVTYKAMRSIIELSRRYIGNGRGFPGKAVSLLDDVVLAARNSGQKVATEDLIREVVSVKSHMDVRKIAEGEKQRLLSLENVLSQRIIGQPEAIRSVVSTLKRARLDIHTGKKPLGTFLFLGPTGVGKTQTAKVLAEEYFGSADAMIRLDMNEYSMPESVVGIVGSSDPSKNSDAFLTHQVQDKPFSLILLDEIEKAHPHVLNLFLQILDEGILTDSRGLKIDFRNSIIIATSNAGALFLRNTLKANPAIPSAELKEGLINSVLDQKIYSPEFLNRFDGVIVFYPLSSDTAARVADILVNEVLEEFRSRRGITIQLQPGALDAVVRKGYSQEFGAREMRRTITNTLENYLADYLLQNDVRRGATISITAEDLLKNIPTE